MLAYENLKGAFESLRLQDKPVIAHASLKSFGEIDGGAQTLLRAVLDSVGALMMPAFTYKTMITPNVGPPNNGITYGAETDLNSMAEPFTPNMPCDKLMGFVPETLRNLPHAKRTSHPIQSFAGVRAEKFLAAQTIQITCACNTLLSQRKVAIQAPRFCLSSVSHTRSNRRNNFPDPLAQQVSELARNAALGSHPGNQSFCHLTVAVHR